MLIQAREFSMVVEETSFTFMLGLMLSTLFQRPAERSTP
jgi:hypothetical protein